jgi:hypothetical protein
MISREKAASRGISLMFAKPQSKMPSMAAGYPDLRYLSIDRVLQRSCQSGRAADCGVGNSGRTILRPEQEDVSANPPAGFIFVSKAADG